MQHLHCSLTVRRRQINFRSLHLLPMLGMDGIFYAVKIANFCCLSGSFKKRKRKSIIVTGMLLIVSVLILIFGLAATTRTQNITVGGYYPGVIVSAHLHQRSRHGSLSHKVVHGNRGLSEVSVSSFRTNNYWRSLVGEFSPAFIIQHRCH